VAHCELAILAEIATKFGRPYGTLDKASVGRGLAFMGDVGVLRLRENFTS